MNSDDLAFFEAYLEDLNAYIDLVSKGLPLLVNDEVATRREQLRRKLIKGRSRIERSTGEVMYQQWGMTSSAWNGLNENTFMSKINLGFIRDAVIREIGDLEEKSDRDANIVHIEGVGISHEQISSSHMSPDPLKQLRIFIGHDGDTAPRRKLVEFISALGAMPIIAELEPKRGRSVADHVKVVMNSRQFGIAIATKEKSSLQDDKPVPRQNVIDEISRMRDHFESKWMIVLENDVVLPSNQAEHVRANFAPQSMDRALTQIVIELRGHGFLKIGS